MSAQHLLEKPNDGGMDDNGITTHKWKVSLFGCCDTLVPNTLMVVFCPCISTAQVLARVGLTSYFTALIVTFLIYLFFFIAMGVPRSGALQAIAAILSILYLGYMVYVRHRLRSFFQIPGNAFEDCLTVVCCSCCSLAQMATHVESYTPGACTFDAKATLPGYVV
ncbi:Aste57867_15942 [Aphanomyces stellatus]|uniref:Aste57867_15942 protein n=1 Tax=Aphanomyces stellatus TaxID=120398 RepID=A0A485L5B6_9STRA|nr:hypothetical protein As57867_015886 [Aphanomyces stellatus]VFT92728.1 Aste57867_15942 [Aphanomyces stellatus]